MYVRLGQKVNKIDRKNFIGPSFVLEFACCFMHGVFMDIFVSHEEAKNTKDFLLMFVSVCDTVIVIVNLSLISLSKIV